MLNLENKININIYFSFRDFIYIFICALISFFYVDYIARFDFGIIFSILLFLIFIIISLRNLSLGIIVSIFYAIIIVEYPRDILDTYELVQITKDVNYNTLGTVKIGPFTLLVYLFFFNTFLVLHKTNLKIIKNKIFFFMIFLLLFISFSSTFITFLIEDTIYFPTLIITNSKFFQFILIGYIQGTYLYKTNRIGKLTRWFYILPIFFGLRNIIFIINDLLSFTPKLDLMNQPYLSLIVLMYIIIKGNWGIYNNIIYRILLFISLLSFSRGFLIILVFCLLLGLIINFHKKIKFTLFFLFSLLVMFCMVLFALYITNERLFDFFIWKINVFNELTNSEVELSGSGKVRIIEMQNIIHILSENIYGLFLGKGFFATYNFEAYSLDGIGIIDLKSYSYDQLSSGIYYATHSFLSSILLKYGLLGLLIYILLPLLLSYKLYIKNYHMILILLPLILIPSYFWRIEFMFIMGLLYGIINLRERKSESEI